MGNSTNNNSIERRNSRFFPAPHCTANRLQHVRSSGPRTIMCHTSGACHVQHVCNTSGACHVQHVVCNTSGACHVQHVVCNTSGACHVQHVVCNTSGACHVQHVVCNTSGACHVQHVVCHMVQRDGSAIKGIFFVCVFFVFFFFCVP